MASLPDQLTRTNTLLPVLLPVYTPGAPSKLTRPTDWHGAGKRHLSISYTRLAETSALHTVRSTCTYPRTWSRQKLRRRAQSDWSWQSSLASPKQNVCVYILYTHIYKLRLIISGIFSTRLRLQDTIPPHTQTHKKGDLQSNLLIHSSWKQYSWEQTLHSSNIHSSAFYSSNREVSLLTSPWDI